MAVTPASAYADSRALRAASTSATHDALIDDLDRSRREGVDPQRDADVVRRLAEGVVRRHDDLSLTGAVAPLAEPDAVVGELLARVSGFGPLQPLLEDPTVEEIWINDPTRVFVARRGRHELTNLVLTRAQVDELVERMLKSSGRRVDISRPFVETKDDYGISTTSRVAMSSIAQPIGQFGGPQVRRNSSAMLDSRNHQAA